MTGRERLQNILHKKPADRLAWTSAVDSATLKELQPPHRGLSAMGFYDLIGCDVFQWGSAVPGRSLLPCSWALGDGFELRTRTEGDKRIREQVTPRGTLTRVVTGGHPSKYAVTTEKELDLVLDLWEATTVEELEPSDVFEESVERVGGRGVVVYHSGPSVIPQLLEGEMGIEDFYYLLADHPDKMEKLFEIMHRAYAESWRIIARGPWEYVVLVENTSTTYIGPDVYRKYNMPHQREFVEIMHEHGKVAILHMCGHVLALLDDIKETGTDGIHALTPAPTGNTPFEAALDVLGDDAIIVGVLDPTVFQLALIDEIGPALDALYTPRLREANLVLSPCADGTAVPLERFLAVSRWMEKNGAR